MVIQVSTDDQSTTTDVASIMTDDRYVNVMI